MTNQPSTAESQRRNFQSKTDKEGLDGKLDKDYPSKPGQTQEERNMAKQQSNYDSKHNQAAK